jgi:RNA polymerase sigma factor (sigma-70 family)
MMAKSEARSTKSETNQKSEYSNDRNENRQTSAQLLWMRCKCVGHGSLLMLARRCLVDKATRQAKVRTRIQQDLACAGVEVSPIPETAIMGPQDAQLVRRIAAGDRSAAEELCQRYRPRAVFLVRQRAFGREDVAEDIAQEAMPALIAAIRDGRLTNPAKIGAYLFRTCSNLAARWRERQERERPLGSTQRATGSDPEESYIEKETQARLMLAFEELSATDREILAQRFAEELSFAQIAANLGITYANARQRARRAVSRLRDRLGTE